MKVSVDLANRQEGDAVRRALEDPTLKTVAIVSGLLLELETISQRLRVLRFVQDLIAGTNHQPVDREDEAQLRLLNASDTGE